jgi:hypothetical protein
MRLIKNLYNVIKLLSVINLSVNKEEINISFLDNYILIKEGQIKVYAARLIFDYEEMFQHCDEWFINSSSDQRDIYLDSVIREEEREEVVICH